MWFCCFFPTFNRFVRVASDLVNSRILQGHVAAAGEGREVRVLRGLSAVADGAEGRGLRGVRAV
jgi:hypothetical protein